MRRKRDYLFLRPGSQHWHIKLQTPGNRVEKSLGTPDRREAEIAALPLIAQHKAALLAKRLHLETVWVHDLEPGREHVDPASGARTIATDRELIHINPDGTTRTASNGGPKQMLIPPYPESSARAVVRFVRKLSDGPVPDDRPALATKTGDDTILETYLKHANVTGYFEREARDMWALYKTLTGNKPLKEADRDDGRKLVQYFKDQGLKSASIQKRVGWLRAAVNLAIKERKECKSWLNPFAGIVPKGDDKERRLPLSDEDMKECRRNLGKLSESDQLLFRVLATTGMRLSEAFEIDSEEKEKGCRFVIVGKKTEQSLRRVPLPASLLPALPATIRGPLFKSGDEAASSKRLNRFLDDIGIIDPHKVAHSLRHRAQDRLRAAACPEAIRWELLGHEKKTVAANYGKGSPVPMLRKWIDKIGF
jgi:integrase